MILQEGNVVEELDAEVWSPFRSGQIPLSRTAIRAIQHRPAVILLAHFPPIQAIISPNNNLIIC